MNLFLAILNLIPVVPLDGSKILFSFFPFKLKNKIKHFMEKNYLIIFILLIIILFQTNILENIVYFIYSLMINVLF